MMRLLLWMIVLPLGLAASPLAVAAEESDKPADEAATQQEADAAESGQESSGDADNAAEAQASAKQESTDAKQEEAAGEGDKDSADDQQPAAKDAEQAESSDKQEQDDESDEEEQDDRETHTVKAGPLKLEATVSGNVVAKQQTEVQLDAETWTKFEIEEIVPHGARVTAGQVLVRFDPEPLTEAIEERELSQRISEIALIKAEKAMPRLEESLARTLRQARRAWDESQQDYKQYTDEERDLIVRSYAARLKQAKFNLDQTKDELDQLQKMYEADDLTEETEELILTRHKTSYELAKFSYEVAKYNNDLAMGVYLPRQDVRLEESQRTVELALERAQQASELDLTRARYELESLRRSREKSLERHAELLADKSWLTIESPTSGYVYYGRCIDGKWSQIRSYKEKLIPGKPAPNGTVLMTIVDGSQLSLLGSLGEADLPVVKNGQEAKVTLKAKGVDPIDAKVAELQMTPASQGSFEIRIDLTGDTPEWLVPGMTGKADIVTYHNKKAVLAPRKAIHEDEEQEREFVWLVDEQADEVTKQWVKTGRGDKENVEVLEGVSEGDVLSLEDEEEADDEQDAQQDEQSADESED